MGFCRKAVSLLKEEPSTGPTRSQYTCTTGVCMVLRTDWRGGENGDAGCVPLVILLAVEIFSQGFEASVSYKLERIVL